LDHGDLEAPIDSLALVEPHLGREIWRCIPSIRQKEKKTTVRAGISNGHKPQAKGQDDVNLVMTASSVDSSSGSDNEQGTKKEKKRLKKEEKKKKKARKKELKRILKQTKKRKKAAKKEHKNKRKKLDGDGNESGDEAGKWMMVNGQSVFVQVG
jgi:hypothetical protein